MSNNTGDKTKLGLLIMVGVFLLGGLCLGGSAGVKAFNRYQAREEAKNIATVARINAENEQYVNKLRIDAQAQKVLIAQQDAKIREEEAIGIKKAQDTISQTLTPLYVQMEMVRTLEQIAKDGKNATVIYIPVDPETGLPLVKEAGK